MSQIAVVEQHTLIESILEPYRAALGASLYRGDRSHAYRMLNFGRALAASEPDRDERLAVMAAFHDLPFCLDGNLDYLDRAGDLAGEWLDKYGRAAWRDEIRLMIGHHHRIRPYRGRSASLVEATRKADWIDVSFWRPPVWASPHVCARCCQRLSAGRLLSAPGVADGLPVRRSQRRAAYSESALVILDGRLG